MATVCVRPSGDFLPQTDLKMPSLEVPASCCATFFPERPGVHAGSYRVSPLRSPTYPQFSRPEGRSVPHSPGSGPLPQPSPWKPRLGSLRQVSWGPSHANLHQQLGKELSRTVVPEAGALGTFPVEQFWSQARGVREAERCPGLDEGPADDRFQVTTAPPSQSGSELWGDASLILLDDYLEP